MTISDLALVCRLVGHKANPARARWNEGICFGKCTRCGRDLVRTVNGFWQVPRGYRVVWRGPPRSAPAQEPAAAAEWPEPEVAVPLEWDQLWEPRPAPVTPTNLAADEELHEEREAGYEVIAPDHEEPVAAEAASAHAPEMTEWPLSPAVAIEEPDRASVESEPDPIPAAEERAHLAPQAGAPDFMDEASEEGWDDFPDLGRQTARV